MSKNTPYSINVRLYPFIAAMQAAWFVEAVWFFYWNRYASFTFIGILFTVGSILAILLELPTGVFADKFGRKKATLIGTFLQAFGCWLIAFGGHIAWLFVGVIAQTIGSAFISGALEALVYDSLKADHLEKQYDQVASKKSQVQILAFAIAAAAGGFLYPIYFRLPHIMMGLALTFGWIVVYWLKEPPKMGRETDKSTSLTLDGLRQLKQMGLRPFMVSVISIMVIYFIYDWGFGKPAIAVHFNMYSREQGVAYGLMALMHAVLIGWLPKIRKKVSDLNGLRWLNLIAAGGFLMTFFPLGWWGIIAMFAIEIATFLSEPWISTIINQHLASEYRATALSAIQLVGRIPYLAINLALGSMLDKGLNQIVFVILGAGIILIQVIDLLAVKYTTAKSTSGVGS